jgi:hypothetical protein
MQGHREHQDQCCEIEQGMGYYGYAQGYFMLQYHFLRPIDHIYLDIEIVVDDVACSRDE